MDEHISWQSSQIKSLWHDSELQNDHEFHNDNEL